MLRIRNGKARALQRGYGVIKINNGDGSRSHAPKTLFRENVTREKMMGTTSKIMWSEGLTLGPQHFQRQDLYHEMRLQRIASALNPYFWGVRSVQWNLDGLGHNRLSADAMSVIFPDGEIYEAPGADLLPEPVDLSRLPADVDVLTFHAALALVKPHGGNADEYGRYVRCDLGTSDLVPLAHMPQVPSAIPVRPNTCYFSLSTKSALYEKALDAGTLAVYAPDGMPGLKMELIAVTQRAEVGVDKRFTRQGPESKKPTNMNLWA